MIYLFEKTLDAYKSVTHNPDCHNTAGAVILRFPPPPPGNNVDISIKYYGAGKYTFLLLTQCITVVKTCKQHAVFLE